MIEIENDQNRKKKKKLPPPQKKSDISTSLTNNKINLNQQKQPNLMAVTLKQFNLVWYFYSFLNISKI